MRPIAISARSMKGTRKIVGVNAYQEDKPLRIPILQMDSAGYERQLQRLAHLAQEPDNARVDRRSIVCASPAQGTENTMPYLLDAGPRLCHSGGDQSP